jgi:hypothetical protein
MEIQSAFIHQASDRRNQTGFDPEKTGAEPVKHYWRHQVMSGFSIAGFPRSYTPRSIMFVTCQGFRTQKWHGAEVSTCKSRDRHCWLLGLLRPQMPAPTSATTKEKGIRAVCLIGMMKKRYRQGFPAMSPIIMMDADDIFHD